MGKGWATDLEEWATGLEERERALMENEGEVIYENGRVRAQWRWRQGLDGKSLFVYLICYFFVKR